jgi:hypothetical protein
MASILDRSLFRRRLAELSPASDRTWLTALTVGLAFTLVAAYVFPGSEEGKLWAYAGLFVRASFYLWSGEALRGRGGETLSRLFRLGLVAGVFELLIDWGLIHWVPQGRLVYLTGNDVVLLGSPVWMPLAWACVIVELGYPALRLFGILSRRMARRPAAIVSSLLIGTGAGVTVGFYEYYAWLAGWWRYEPAHSMVGPYCAAFIPLGEVLMFLAVLPIAACALDDDELPTAAAIAGGARFATAIAAGYALAYLLLEVGRPVG